MSLEYSWGSAGFGEKGKKGTFVWGGPASCHDNGPGAAPQVRLDPDTGGRLRWLETRSSPLLRWKSGWWQGDLPLRTHTPLSEGRKVSFSGARRSARKTDEDPNRKQTEQEPKRNRKAPRWVSAGKTPTKKHEKRETEFRVTAEGKEPQTVQKPSLTL